MDALLIWVGLVGWQEWYDSIRDGHITRKLSGGILMITSTVLPRASLAFSLHLPHGWLKLDIFAKIVSFSTALTLELLTVRL